MNPNRAVKTHLSATPACGTAMYQKSHLMYIPNCCKRVQKDSVENYFEPEKTVERAG